MIDDDVVFDYCPRCGEFRELTYCIDPFIDEVYSQQFFEWWCDECWEDRKRDI